MQLQIDLNDLAQAYKQQRDAQADQNALLAAANGVLQRRVEKLEEELAASKKPVEPEKPQEATP